MKIIAGLGNPGNKYNNTRHNVGFIILDWILNNPKWEYNKKFKSFTYSENSKLYLKPQTYMNKSGEAISQTLNYYKLIPKNLNFFQKKDTNLKEKLVIIHDDLDIEIGKIKISENSSSAGHKGVESIITHLKTKNFIRIRVGIKKPIELEKIPTEKYVLTKFSNNEINKIKEAWNNLYSIIKEKTDL